MNHNSDTTLKNKMDETAASVAKTTLTKGIIESVNVGELLK